MQNKDKAVSIPEAANEIFKNAQLGLYRDGKYPAGICFRQ